MVIMWALERYYAQLQDLSQRNGRLAWVPLVVVTLQLVTLLVPIETEDYSDEQLGMVWRWVKAAVRPDHLLTLCEAPEWLTACLLCAAFLCRVTTGLLTFLELRHKEASEFESWPSTTVLASLPFLDFYLAIGVSELLWLPTLCFFASLAFRLTSDALLQLSAGMAGAFLVTVVTFDRVNMSDPMWRVSGPGSVQPDTTLIYTLLDLIPALLASAFTYGSSDIVIRLFTIPVSGLKLANVYSKKPYQSDTGNDLLSFQAAAMLLVLLLLSLPQSHFPSVSFLILLPVLYTANAFTRRYLSRVLLWGDSFHNLLHSIVTQGSLEDIESLAVRYEGKLQAFRLPELSLQQLLEAAYFYQLANNRYLVRVAVAMLGPHQTTSIAASICIMRLLGSLNIRTTRKMVTADEVVAKYIDFAACRTLLTDSDRLSMQLLRTFYEKLLSGADSFQQLVRLVHRLDYQLHSTDEMYKRSIKLFEKKASLVKAYRSFLYIIGRKEKVSFT